MLTVPNMRSWFIFILIALVGAVVITRGLIAQPGFTDAFYHFNAANRLVGGESLTDPYLWTYIGATDSLPQPSHLYWMPLTSLAAALGMWALNAPGNYYAAQVPFALMLAGTACVGFWLGRRIGGGARHAWVAGLLTLCSGYFTRFWGATDTFAPYALVGSLCLVMMGLGVEQNGRSKPRPYMWFMLAGALAALGHLTRNDGILLLIVGWMVVLWRPLPVNGEGLSKPVVKKVGVLLVMTLAYLVVMLPWFVRNLNAVGSALPVGGMQAIWFTGYDDIFSYPPDSGPQTFFADGLGTLLATRWEALTNNLGTFIAVEGLIVMTPLMLLGLWRRRRDGFLRGFWLYALGLHLAMTLIFPFPGYRGGLFHSAAALIPWWAALGVAGLDDAVEGLARRRRRGNPTVGKLIFSAVLVGFAVYLSVSVGLRGRVNAGTPALYVDLARVLPADARVMINDPALLYYFTGRGGVVLPNEAPDVIPDIARRYGVTHLLLESPGATPSPLWSLFETTPIWLTPIPLNDANVRLYALDSTAF